MLKTSRYVFLFPIVLLLSTMLACSNFSSGDPAGNTTSAAVSIEVQTQPQAKQLSPFLGTVNDITSLTVDVMNGGTSIITGQQLTYSNGVWSGTLPNLPIGPSLTFVGHAYNASAVQIFTGTTIQAMTGHNDSVSILLAPVTNGVTQVFPKITKILVPSQIFTSNTVTIGISIAASSGETLTYATTAAPVGGSFSPSSGTIHLSGTTATLVLSYTAPSTAGTYTHSIRVTNSQSNWVETNFSTVVSPGTVSSALTVQFAPVITAIGAQRNGSNVTFTAIVSDATPTTLTYSWGFDGGLTFVNNTTNPAVLQGYDETKSGNLTLTVTNGTGGATTVSYAIAPGLLPDNVVVLQGAQWAQSVTAGFGNSSFGGVSVGSDGSVYAAGYIYGTGTHNFGNSVTSAGTYTSGVNIVLVKYNSAGVAQWAQTVTAGSNESSFSGVSVGSDGSVYAAGHMHGTGTYNFGNSVSSAGTYTSGDNIVLVKYNSAGIAQWAKSLTAGSSQSTFWGVSVGSDGSVYAAGYMHGTGTYNFGNSVTSAGTYTSGDNIILVKYNSAGVAQWAKSLTAGSNYSYFSEVSVGSDGSVYATGYIVGNGTYNFGNNVTAAGAPSVANIILVKYNSAGVAQWAQTVTAGSGNSYFVGISVGSDSSVYAAGYIMGTDTYNFGNSIISAGTYSGNNIVLVKYNSAGVAQWAQTVTAGSSDSVFSGVSVGSDGSVYAAGYILGTDTYNFGNSVTAAGTFTRSIGYDYNIILVKYNSAGVAQWAQTVTAGSDESSFAGVSVGSDGSVYAAGYIRLGGTTYNFGNGVTAAGTGDFNIVLVKYY